MSIQAFASSQAVLARTSPLTKPVFGQMGNQPAKTSKQNEQVAPDTRAKGGYMRKAMYSVLSSLMIATGLLGLRGTATAATSTPPPQPDVNYINICDNEYFPEYTCFMQMTKSQRDKMIEIMESMPDSMPEGATRQITPQEKHKIIIETNRPQLEKAFKSSGEPEGSAPGIRSVGVSDNTAPQQSTPPPASEASK